MKVSGLNQTRRYRFGFIGSSSPQGWYKDNYTATYSINGRTVYLNSWSNSSKIVYIGDVIPDDGGEVLLNFSTTQAAAYGFNAGIIIEDYTDVQGGTMPNVANFNRGNQLAESSQNIQDQTTVRVYPNPFIDYINLEFYNDYGSNRISALLYDIAGRLIERKTYSNLAPGYNTLRLSAGPVRSKTGVYTVVLYVNDKIVLSRKMLRTRK
jgi:hypothetical protein